MPAISQQPSKQLLTVQLSLQQQLVAMSRSMVRRPPAATRSATDRSDLAAAAFDLLVASVGGFGCRSGVEDFLE